MCMAVCVNVCMSMCVSCGEEYTRDPKLKTQFNVYVYPFECVRVCVYVCVCLCLWV